MPGTNIIDGLNEHLWPKQFVSLYCISYTDRTEQGWECIESLVSIWY